MIKEQRLQIIIKYLQNKSFVKITKLQEKTQIPIATLHRDLKYLESTSTVSRSHGSVILQTKKEDYFKNLGINTSIKLKLAQKAAQHIKDEMLIFIDAGTTTLHIVDFIDSSFKNLTIVTNSISLVSLAHKYNFNFKVLGGDIKKTTNAVVGTTTISELRKYHFDLAFVGVNGCANNYLSTPSSEEADLKTAIIKQSEKTFFVFDQSKFEKQFKYNFASTSKGILIT